MSVARSLPGARALRALGSGLRPLSKSVPYRTAVLHWSMTERPRFAQPEPRSLLLEQMGQLNVTTPAVPQRVQAWVLWEDGVEELTQAHAIAWTQRAVWVRLGVPLTNTRCGSGLVRSSESET